MNLSIVMGGSAVGNQVILQNLVRSCDGGVAVTDLQNSNIRRRTPSHWVSEKQRRPLRKLTIISDIEEVIDDVVLQC